MNKKYKYNHIGIPTTKKIENEEYLEEYDIYHSGYQENEFNIEWMRYGEKCQLPDIVKKLPHVAFVLVNDAPVEFIQFI